MPGKRADTCWKAPDPTRRSPLHVLSQPWTGHIYSIDLKRNSVISVTPNQRKERSGNKKFRPFCASAAVWSEQGFHTLKNISQFVLTLFVLASNAVLFRFWPPNSSALPPATLVANNQHWNNVWSAWRCLWLPSNHDCNVHRNRDTLDRKVKVICSRLHHHTDKGSCFTERM